MLWGLIVVEDSLVRLSPRMWAHRLTMPTLIECAKQICVGSLHRRQDKPHKYNGVRPEVRA